MNSKKLLDWDHEELQQIRAEMEAGKSSLSSTEWADLNERYHKILSDTIENLVGLSWDQGFEAGYREGRKCHED
jgi:hypothetical protein